MILLLNFYDYYCTAFHCVLTMSNGAAICGGATVPSSRLLFFVPPRALARGFNVMFWCSGKHISAVDMIDLRPSSSMGEYRVGQIIASNGERHHHKDDACFKPTWCQIVSCVAAVILQEIDTKMLPEVLLWGSNEEWQRRIGRHETPWHKALRQVFSPPASLYSWDSWWGKQAFLKPQQEWYRWAVT